MTAEDGLGILFLFVSLIKSPNSYHQLSVGNTFQQDCFSEEAPQREGQAGAQDVTAMTISTLPAASQMSPFFYKMKLQLKPDVYLYELFWGPNGRFLTFHPECSFQDNSK